MKKETMQAIVKMFNTASKDTIKFNIGGVLMIIDGPNIKLISTDGYTLSEKEVKDDTFTEDFKGEYFVMRDQERPLKGIIKEMKYFTDLDHIINGSKFTIAFGGYTTTFATTKDLNVVFPDYKRFVPAIPDDAVTISLDASLLLNVAKALQEHDKHLGVTLIFTGDNTKPILVKASGNNGLIMPVKL